ncbi:MAG: hypothetical protein KBC64_02370 [Simkaniaceae bacterium]|nr:hypothetical protein [Simkaniaceae bacterium]
MEQERQKMCWNCDADVSVEATYCPFCGTDLMVGNESDKGKEVGHRSETLQESLASLYKPPYSSGREEQGNTSSEIHRISPDHDLSAFLVEDKKDPTARLGYGWCLIFLSIGTFLVTLSLLLLFLSKDGKLILEFNARSWFLYGASGAPLLFLGYKLLNRGKKEETPLFESSPHASSQI